MSEVVLGDDLFSKYVQTDLLHGVDLFGRIQGEVVVLVIILDGSGIDRLVPGMRGVFGARVCWMLELVEGFLNVCGHLDVTNHFSVVPINGQTTIEGASLVNGYSIQLL